VECQRLTGLSADDGLQIFLRLNQCESAGDSLALNRLALARNGYATAYRSNGICGLVSKCNGAFCTC